MEERKILDIANLVHGAEGTVYAIRNGEMIPLLTVVSMEVDVSKEKETKHVLGTKVAKNRLGGYTLSGSMSCYYCSSIFARDIIDDIKNHVNTQYTIVATNEDPDSRLGRQTMTFYGVDFDTVPLYRLDIEASDITIDLPFTFEDVDLTESFSTEVNK